MCHRFVSLSMNARLKDLLAEKLCLKTKPLFHLYFAAVIFLLILRYKDVPWVCIASTFYPMLCLKTY